MEKEKIIEIGSKLQELIKQINKTEVDTTYKLSPSYGKKYHVIPPETRRALKIVAEILELMFEGD